MIFPAQNPVCFKIFPLGGVISAVSILWAGLFIIKKPGIIKRDGGFVCGGFPEGDLGLPRSFGPGTNTLEARHKSKPY